MSTPETTFRHQSALAEYCRTGKYQAIPGVRGQHVTHYRRLVYNVVDDMLQSAYPLTHNLLTTREWNALVQEFFASHPCQSPQVWYMPRELYEYLSSKAHKLEKKYPFLLELLWLEWLEVQLFMMEDRPAAYTTIGHIDTDPLVLNPEYHLQHFEYPVHLKNAKQLTAADKGDYFLVLFRKPDSGEVTFMNLWPALVAMLEILQESPQTMPALVQQCCAAWQLPVTPEVEAAARDFVSQALNTRLIIGFKTKH
ncbi:MAG TPA: putative DNA-binding domain-containing protein [Chitinophaga sp.]|uniref:HvfC/BufC N-terminal domain-containing protein n=1 Tax=Chitinophaga sp. TaxID=1869181 RepID=UPI002DB9B2BD|nr:putative DNA-binding domain-containing protein [Chitinophaga sp.]HEU4554643.1 putative DNA-binding domain-containing protein [Chitinophaga sp.]